LIEGPDAYIVITSCEAGYHRRDEMERIEAVIFDWGGVLIDEPCCIEAAKRAGLRTILFQDAGQLEQELSSLGVKLA